MCGIAGSVWFQANRQIDRVTLERMTDALTHRGPDDRGFFYQGSGVALGFRRLSIIDVEGGHQPLGNEDGSIQLVFNGEIYNYRELRRRLEGAGHRFATNTDSETIVHLYEDLGTECFSHLNGMFSIAIWDGRKQRLVLARDRLGKKPLYYAQQDGRLSFASELKSLACLPDLPRRVDPHALDLYFTYQYIPHPYTIYQGISKLSPGTFGIYENDQWHTESFWNIDWQREIDIPHPEAVEQLRALLIDAVRLRLRSDVPLGAFLSGGVDSSLIVAIAQRQLDKPIKTFSIGFAEADFDETQYAQQVAQFVGTEHRRFEVRPDALSILDKLVHHYDEPFSDSSALPTWYLCEETRKHVTVALSGDGGDELFAGYERYRALQLSGRVAGLGIQNWLPRGAWWQRWGAGSKRRSLIRRVQRFGEALGMPADRRYLRWLTIFDETARWEMYRDDFAETLPDHDPFEFLQAAWKKSGDRDLIAKAGATDLQTYLPCDLMTKVDIASMAHGLEARQPFLDYRLVEFAASLPSRLKLRSGRGKRLLYDAFSDWIPASIWKRPKMGFGIPVAAWFRGPLRSQTESWLLGNDSRCLQFLRADALRSLIERHMNGTGNEGYRLWNLLILEAWLRKWG